MGYAGHELPPPLPSRLRKFGTSQSITWHRASHSPAGIEDRGVARVYPPLASQIMPPHGTRSNTKTPARGARAQCHLHLRTRRLRARLFPHDHVVVGRLVSVDRHRDRSAPPGPSFEGIWEHRLILGVLPRLAADDHADRHLAGRDRHPSRDHCADPCQGSSAVGVSGTSAPPTRRHNKRRGGCAERLAA